MNQTWENGKNLILGLIFGSFDPNFGFRIIFGFISTSCQTVLQAIILCNLKEN